MARKPQHPAGNREKIIEAVMTLLAERPVERIGFGDIAVHSDLTLAQCRAEFGSVIAVIAAHAKQVDQKVLAGGDDDMAGEPPREQLFDVLMRRLEALNPHKEAVRSLLRSASRNPGIGMALNAMTVRSMQWMLTAAHIDAAGPRGILRAQGLAVLYASVLRTWIHDDDSGLARTMAALDRGLARGARWEGLLGTLCRFSPARCRRHGRRRFRTGSGDESAVAA